MSKKDFSKALFLLLALTRIGTYFCQGQESNVNFKLLKFGMVSLIRDNSEAVVGSKWGIEFDRVAGCVVSKHLVDSVEQHNKTAELLIEGKFGKGWRKKFYLEVDAEAKRQLKVSAIVDQVEYVRKKEMELNKEFRDFIYTMTPIEGTTKYDVWIQGWVAANDDFKWVTYFHLIVDCHTESVQSVSNTIAQ